MIIILQKNTTKFTESNPYKISANDALCMGIYCIDSWTLSSWYKYNIYCENTDMVSALKVADDLHLGVANGN